MIYRKEYMEELNYFKDNKIIKVVTGMRRSGKSTLLNMFCDELLANGVTKEQIQFINFELMKYDSIRNYKDFYDLVVSNILTDRKNYLFFDEIQQVQGWEKAINSISIEYDADIYITGSNAYLLSSELSTLISGRYVEIKILPLSFKEYFEYHKDRNISKEDIFNNYLKYGGLPQLLTLPNEEKAISDFLSSIYDTVILKDVLSRNKLRDIDLINEVFTFICRNVGSVMSPNKIANYITKEAKLDTPIRPATIGNILEMLENAFIIFKVNRYDVRGKDILKSLEKYYLADSGLKNFVTGFGLENYGYTIENVIYLELIRRGFKVFVGKNKTKEIDFVAKKSDTTIYYQVTDTLLNQSTQKREVSSFNSTNDFYEKIIITTDKTYTTNLKGIKVINIIDFLLS